MPKLLSDWIKVATAGETIDGRVIHAQWLTDMVETYDRSEYAALIWDSHEHNYDLGVVHALKTEADKKGRLTLLAQFEPSGDLVWMGKNRTLFSSIEVDDKRLPDGRAYLGGIAMTSEPASWATDQVKFSKQFSKRRKKNLPVFSKPLRTRKPTFKQNHSDEELTMELEQKVDAILANQEAQNAMLTQIAEAVVVVAETVEEVAVEVTEGAGGEGEGNHSRRGNKVNDAAEKFSAAADKLAATVERLQAQPAFTRKPGNGAAPRTHV